MWLYCLGSLALLMFLPTESRYVVSALETFQFVLLPHSIGYYLYDIFIYAIPCQDYVILGHHILMLVCTYPLTSIKGIYWVTAGDPLWGIKLCMIGYGCAELAVPVLNLRWWLSRGSFKCSKYHTNTTLGTTGGQQLRRSARIRERAERTGNLNHSNVCTNRSCLRVHIGLHFLSVLVFVVRVIAFSCLTAVYVFPRYDDFLFKFKQPVTFVLIIAGHIGVLCVSAYWLRKVIEIGSHPLNAPIVSSGVLQKHKLGGWYLMEVWHGRGLIDQITSDHAGYLSTVRCKNTMSEAMKKAKHTWLWPFYCLSCLGFTVVGLLIAVLCHFQFITNPHKVAGWLSWEMESALLMFQGLFSFMGDVVMEFHDQEEKSKWYLADRMFATSLFIALFHRFAVKLSTIDLWWATLLPHDEKSLASLHRLQINKE
eukprot:g1561.t1